MNPDTAGVMDSLSQVIYSLNIARKENQHTKEANAKHDEVLRQQIAILQAECKEKDEYIRDLLS